MNNPLQQYIDLYTGNPDMVQGNPGGALNQARDKALERLLEERRLPDRSDEGYAKTSVAEMFAPDYGINLQRHPVTVDLASSFHCGVPNLSTLMAVVAVDRFAPTRTLQQNLPQGVVVCSLAEGVRQEPGLDHEVRPRDVDLELLCTFHWCCFLSLFTVCKSKS